VSEPADRRVRSARRSRHQGGPGRLTLWRLTLTVQVLYALGLLGGCWIALSQQDPVVVHVIQSQWAALFVGPMFAAVTALAIKEGLCYGKLEAALLALVRYGFAICGSSMPLFTAQMPRVERHVYDHGRSVLVCTLICV
jgi:uncharacterized integral membrane protein